ncbi:hypothetical protein Ct61P_00758 [Colletotrichum tofieldiae]|nr:hypothetical protein Ct61P_00758 [Colletotrichum tofieldiae]
MWMRWGCFNGKLRLPHPPCHARDLPTRLGVTNTSTPVGSCRTLFVRQFSQDRPAVGNGLGEDWHPEPTTLEKKDIKCEPRRVAAFLVTQHARQPGMVLAEEGKAREASIQNQAWKHWTSDERGPAGEASGVQREARG